MKLRKIALAAVLLAGSLPWAAQSASASSPYGCPKMPGGTGTVCYQIVGSGQTVNFWQGANKSDQTVKLALYSPTGLWWTDTLTPTETWIYPWGKLAEVGDWCADCWSTAFPVASVDICYQVK